MPVGPSPFRADFSDWYSKNRYTANKKEFKSLQAGYPTRNLKSNLTGDVYMLPRHDYDELVKYFNEHHSELSDTYTSDGKQLYTKIQTPADYIDFAFEKQSQQKNLTTAECQGGHIKKLTYNPMYKLLMVEFTNRGDICVFFDLPANKAATLMYLAENNTMAPPDKHGRERHAVGVEFWNLVRIRGSIHNTQHPFQYTKDMRTGEPFGRRSGTGATGKGENKWVYMEAERQRRGFKHDTREEITGPVKIRTRASEIKQDSYIGENGDARLNPYEYTIDDFADYFEGDYRSAYARHKAMTATNSTLSSNLKQAEAIYNSGDGSDAALDKMAKLLASTGFDFPEPNPDYL